MTIFFFQVDDIIEYCQKFQTNRKVHSILEKSHALLPVDVSFKSFKRENKNKSIDNTVRRRLRTNHLVLDNTYSPPVLFASSQAIVATYRSIPLSILQSTLNRCVLFQSTDRISRSPLTNARFQSSWSHQQTSRSVLPTSEGNNIVRE